MSTSLFFHAFGLEGYDHVPQDFIAGNIVLKAHPDTNLSAVFAVAPETAPGTALLSDGARLCPWA